MENILSQLLQPDVQQFIKTHEKDDPFSLSLRFKDVSGVAIKIIAEQIAAKQKAKTKLPEWYATEGIIFPPLLSMEQCSSEVTAKYKSQLFQGRSLADLTGGAGVDTCYLAKNYSQVHYVEQYAGLAETTAHNFKVLNVDNCKIHITSAETFLEQLHENVDNFYIDPARRDDHAQKVFRFADCTPNVINLLPILLAKGKQVIIKASPMLDIDQALNELDHVRQIHVISVDNECKEVLYIIDNEQIDDVDMFTVNLKKNDMKEFFTYKKREESLVKASYAPPLKFLYEPNTSILKAGAFQIISLKYNVDKLHQHTHLYTSTNYVDNFPGRKFRIIDVLPYNKKIISKTLGEKKANITARNFPDDVKTIRKKLGLTDGGNKYLFAFTDIENEKRVAVTEKV